MIKTSAFVQHLVPVSWALAFTTCQEHGIFGFSSKAIQDCRVMSCSSDFWAKEAASAPAGFGIAARAGVPVSVMAAERDSYPASGHVCLREPGLTAMKLFLGERTHTHV